MAAARQFADSTQPGTLFSARYLPAESAVARMGTSCEGTFVKRILLLFAAFSVGCSGVKDAGLSGGTTQNAVISGPYSAVATSTVNNTTANLSMQGSTSFSASQNTLVCPGNMAANCTGDDPPTVVYTLSGTVSGNNVQIRLQFNNASGADTVTLTGTVNGTTLGGSYTDSQGDSGTWTATLSGSVSGTYNGSVNSTPNPQPIAPTVSALITEGQNSSLTGSASVANSLCFASLDFSQGTAIGGAFTLTDTTKGVFILGVPVGSNTYNVSYQVASSAIACAGDYGTGTFTLQ
jgi:hypothetical protein